MNTGVDHAGFFEGLSVIGWLGIAVWVVFIALVIFNGRRFIDYEERLPKMDFWDEFLYEEWHYYVFMIVRFVLILIALLVITRIMFAV